MKEGDLIQVAHAVRDIERAMRHYWEKLGIGPWDVYTFGPPALRDSMVRGRPSDHTYSLAVVWIGGVQLELIQPLTGRSIYDDFLEQKGEGLHHIKLYYPDTAQALRRLAGRGLRVIQSGRFDEDEFYYLDTEEGLGAIIEIGNNGRIREPQRRYPA